VIHVFGAPDPPAPRLVQRLRASAPAAAAGAEAAGPATLVLGATPMDALALGVLVGGWRKAHGARLLVLSALGAHPDARSPRLRALWELEEQARAFALPVLVLRLAPLVGPDSPLWRKLASGPRLPRGGRALLQPVLEDDVMLALERALDDDAPWSGWFEVAGPEVLSLAELTTLARAARGAERTGAAWEPPLAELEEHRLAEPEPWAARFGVTPRRVTREAATWR
jgi:uncharacterized protein YbjT (DUF2867 family)